MSPNQLQFCVNEANGGIIEVHLWEVYYIFDNYSLGGMDGKIRFSMATPGTRWETRYGSFTGL